MLVEGICKSTHHHVIVLCEDKRLKSTSMQRESVRRGFGISHQKVVLQVDIGGKTAHGYTELTIVPLSRDLRTIHLHARCDIHSVGVSVAPGTDTVRADFVHHDPTQISVSDPTDVHIHPELKRKLFAAEAEADEGELSVAIPQSFSLHPVSLDSCDNMYYLYLLVKCTGRCTG